MAFALVGLTIRLSLAAGSGRDLSQAEVSVVSRRTEITTLNPKQDLRVNEGAGSFFCRLPFVGESPKGEHG